MPRTKHSKGKVEGHKLKIQEIFDTLNAPSAPIPVDSRGSATTSKSGSGAPLAHFADLVGSTDHSCFFNFNILACGRLVRRAFTPRELPSLIEVIFSSQDESDTIRRLLGDDVQAFVDVMDEARFASTHHREPVLIETDTDIFCHQALDRPDLSPQTRENCLRTLCKMCGRHALLPTTLKTPISFEPTGNVVYSGGYADVWKGEHCGRDVAVKVIRIYSNNELQRVIGVSRWLRFVPTCLCIDTTLCRGSVRRLSCGKPSGIQMSCH